MTGRKQFNPDAALERAMLTFWELGWSATSIDVLCTAMGLGRSSLYTTFGGKDELFRASLERYGQRYERSYEAALAAHPGDAVAAVGAFFQVTLDRIADPGVPTGCLVAQTTMSLPQLSAASAATTRALLQGQRRRLRAAFANSPVPADLADALTVHLLGVNHSLAVLSRAGSPVDELRSVVAVSVRGVEKSLV